MKADIRYPNITVALIGRDSNALSVVAAVNQELKRAGVSQQERDRFRDEALSGDFDHLLQTCLKWVDVE